MSTQHSWDLLAEQILTDRQVSNILVLFLRNRGVRGTRASDLAEDAVQEAVTRFLNSKKQERKPCLDYLHFRNTILRIARNYLVDQHRKKQKECPMSDDDANSFVAPPTRPLASLWAVHLCLNRLPEDDRAFLEMYYEEGLSLRQIAEDLGVAGTTENASVLTAYRRRNAILERLRQELIAVGFDPDEGLIELGSCAPSPNE